MTFAAVCANFIKETETHHSKMVRLLYHTQPGSKRRRQLSELIVDDVMIPVNMKYTIQIKDDVDLQRLLKNGTHEVVSVYRYGIKHKRQYLKQKV